MRRVLAQVEIGPAGRHTSNTPYVLMIPGRYESIQSRICPVSGQGGIACSIFSFRENEGRQMALIVSYQRRRSRVAAAAARELDLCPGRREHRDQSTLDYRYANTCSDYERVAPQFLPILFPDGESVDRASCGECGESRRRARPIQQTAKGFWLDLRTERRLVS